MIVGESGPTPAGWHSIESVYICPKDYQYRHVRGIYKPGTQTPDHFAVGIGVHAGRARWFSLKFDTSEKAWLSIREAVRKELEAQKLPATLKAEQNALAYLAEYIDHWGKRARPMPVATEYLLGPAPLQPDDPFYFYRTARLDDVSRYPEAGDALCLGEAKTTSTSINDCINQYTLHGQILLQLVLWRMAPQGEARFGKVAGVMLDVIKKGYGGEKSSFARTFLPVTDRMLDWYTRNMRGYLKAAAAIDWNTDAPRNITACTRTVGRGRVACDYRELCMYGRSASIEYVMRGGKSLMDWRPDAERKVGPWE